MKYPISEVYDRLSIEILKSQRASAENHEIRALLMDDIFQHGYQISFLDRLIVINGKIWDLESDIRRGKEDELGLEEVGRRALAIRDFNAQRISIKNEITQFYNEGFEERKYNHASQ